jgi:hypothetical protein
MDPFSSPMDDPLGKRMIAIYTTPDAYEEYGHDESRAFAVAHHAAKQAGEKKPGAPH